MKREQVYRLTTIFTLFISLLIGSHVRAQQVIIYCDFNGNEIRRTVMGTSIDETIESTGNQPRNLILDHTNDDLYWIENDQDVFTMNIDGSEKQEVPINSSEDIGDLSIDEENSILYFTEFSSGNIKAFDLQSQDVMTLITEAEQASIAYSEVENALYYSDASTQKLNRYDLFFQTTYEFSGDFPIVNDIAIDPLNGYVYFSDFLSRQIFRYDFDGTTFEILQEDLGVNGTLYVKPQDDIYFWCDNLAPIFAPVIYQSSMSSNNTEDLFEDSPNSIGGFVVLDDIATNTLEGNSDSFTCFPNPASEELTIDLGEVLDVKTIEIYAINGQLVQKQSVKAVTDQFRVSVENLNNGIYILKLSGSNKLKPIQFEVIR